MTSVIDILRGINAYPIPMNEIMGACQRRYLSYYDEATKDILDSKAFNLVKADLLLWLSIAPNISQGGQSYSFSDQQPAQPSAGSLQGVRAGWFRCSETCLRI